MTCRRSITTLLIAVCGTMTLTLGLLAGGVAVFHGGAGWWRGWGAAAVITSISAVVSMAPLVPGLMVGGQWAIYAYLGSTAARLLVTTLGCIAAVWVVRVPAVPTLMLTVPLYFVQLVVEVVTVGRSFQSDAPAVLGNR